jgi:transcriptional regulator with XRE-family HTH domain
MAPAERRPAGARDPSPSSQARETLAFAADLDPTHVGRIERGHGNPRLESLSSLARALGISLCALMLAVEAEPGKQ